MTEEMRPEILSANPRATGIQCESVLDYRPGKRRSAG
jgi:hypothetical protein